VALVLGKLMGKTWTVGCQMQLICLQKDDAIMVVNDINLASTDWRTACRIEFRLPTYAP
jgi:hypothetical protein